MSDGERTAKFTWGDEVSVAATAPLEFRPGAYAAVCGVSEPDAAGRDYVYLIEYDDGSSLEIAEKHLAAYDSSHNASPDDNPKV